MITATSWRCLDCPLTGAGPNSDREAEKHTNTSGHATSSRVAAAAFADQLPSSREALLEQKVARLEASLELARRDLAEARAGITTSTTTGERA